MYGHSMDTEPAAVAGVPPFKKYFASAADMDPAQRGFFEQVFKPAFLRGEHVDLDGQDSYGFVLFGGLGEAWALSEPERFREAALRVIKFYPGSSLARHATGWAADTYLLAGDYQAAYDLLETSEQLGIETYIGISEALVDSRVTGRMAWAWTTSKRLRPYGLSRKDEVLREVERLLDEEHARLGSSVVSALWRALAIERMPHEPAPALVHELLDGRVIDQHLGWYLGFMQIYGGRPRPAYGSLRLSETRAISWPSEAAQALETYSTYGFNLIVREYLHGVFRAAENNVRAGAGLPRIGEGWVSEIDLYHRLRDAVPHTRIIHQARPAWLKPQSLDIYLPEWGVAVEYQGEQHHRPVDLFGGQEAFARQQERDERKRKLCAAYGYNLIEVLPGYDFDEVLVRVLAARSTRSS